MEKKPVKRNPHIVKLSQDHHASLMFCWKIRQGAKYHAATERMVKYVQYFWEHHFSEHFKEEEEFLFAPLKDAAVLKAIEDHQKIKTKVDKIIISGNEDQQTNLLKLADLVDQHVRYEERILFPHLEKKLSEEQLQIIGSQISDKPLKDDFEDPFWTKPKPVSPDSKKN